VLVQNKIKKTVHNSRFAKAGVSCFYDSEVLNSSFVHLMKFSAENPRLRKAAKRQAVKKTTFSFQKAFLQVNNFDLSQANF
jgi:hypothetical protein